MHLPIWAGHGILATSLIAFCRVLPEFKGKGRIYETLSAIFFHGEVPFRDPETGANIRLDATDFIGRQVAYHGNYEPASIALARRLMAGGGCFVDVGSNVGLYSVSVGILPNVEVIALDASFLALNKLGRNIQRNPGIRAKIVSCALASGYSIQEFELPLVRNIGTMRVSEAQGAGQFYAAAASLEDILTRINPPKIKLLKIDVEGFEYHVFKGLNFDGKFRPQNLIVECDTEFPLAIPCHEHLLAQGYQALTIDGKDVTSLENLPEKNVWYRCTKSNPG